jgi:NarL family two-component system response regulator LiaR
MIDIFLIDDHPLAINGIGSWLGNTGRFAVAGTAGTLAEAHSALEKLDPLPQVVILDVSLGAEDGLEFIPALKEICAKKPAAVLPRILVCSMYEDPFLVKRALSEGANAYVAKSADASEIITAIDAILSGKTYVNEKYKIKEPKSAWSALTLRENEIVSLIKRSMSNRQIAKQMGLSIRTVENHLSHIYVKTGASSRSELFDL